MDFGLMTVGGDRQHSDEPPGGDAVENGGSKQERSGPSKVPCFLWRSTDDASVPGKATMLSFSSSKSEEIPFLSTGEQEDSSSKTICFPLFQSQHKRGPHSAASVMNLQPSAYGNGGLNESLRGDSARLSGPFTPSQWMELEHQALIYKHIMANVPIPSNLLIPLMKSLNPYAFSVLSSGSYAPNWGWGGFHLGYSANTDPEPGRCRRTDGKKWRCARDAVPDQKYCERHINRGRHRSRKPVEGQTGHAVSGLSTSSKVSPIASSSSASATVISRDGTSNSFGATKHQFDNSKPNPSTDHLINNRTQGHSLISPSMDLKSKDSTISIQKQQNNNPYKESSQFGFGFPSSDSVHNRPFINSDTLLDFNGQASNEQQNLVHPFTDGWTKERSDWTQLSMSIPISSSGFSSSSSSPRQEKPTISPLRLSHELEPFQMGLGPTQKTSNWIPVSWGNSMGGPLGEVLNNTPTEIWNSSPYVGSSPTGVLQKSSFVSLSNSSTASSPREG